MPGCSQSAVEDYQHKHTIKVIKAKSNEFGTDFDIRKATGVCSELMGQGIELPRGAANYTITIKLQPPTYSHGTGVYASNLPIVVTRCTTSWQ